LSTNHRSVKHQMSNYNVGGGTHIGSGIKAGHDELKKAPNDLVKVMVVVSDGEGSDDRAARIQLADAAKADNITIFAFGFNGVQASTMSDIAGNKQNTCGSDCTLVVSGGLSELSSYIENSLCKAIPTPPPTPAPTLECAVPKESNIPGSAFQNKDQEWNGCLGESCKIFPYANGSSDLCLQQALAGVCDDPASPFYSPCSCTCGRCCELTPEPTPAPTATDSPTFEPTLEPTYMDCTVHFELNITRRSKWLAAKDVIVQLLEQCDYEYEPTWKKMVAETRVKVVRDGMTYGYNGPDGIAKEPFEPLTLTICMPADWDVRQESVKCRGEAPQLTSSAKQRSQMWDLFIGTCIILLASQ
jgi:hypothetical protein